jgi:Fe-S cluster assembly scaffold protein SufB
MQIIYSVQVHCWFSCDVLLILTVYIESLAHIYFSVSAKIWHKKKFVFIVKLVWKRIYFYFFVSYSFQNTSSTYEFVEVSTGGRLNRHNLHIQQLGPETVTELSTFHLTSQNKQIHDLHSRLILDYPGAYSRQLHKLIACGAGNGIFDGNIQVNRYLVRLLSFLNFF